MTRYRIRYSRIDRARHVVEMSKGMLRSLSGVDGSVYRKWRVNAV